MQGQERPSGTQEKPSGGASVTQYKKTPAEAAALEAAFAEYPFCGKARGEEIAAPWPNLTARRVMTWFNNRRLRIAKERKQEKGEPQPSAEKPEKGPP